MHFVQDPHIQLDQAVSSFLAKGFLDGEVGLVLATMSHRSAVEAKLRQTGFHIPELLSSGLYFPFDARQLLARFLQGGVLDEAAFRSTVGNILALARKPDRALRVVPLLEHDDQRIQELWEELAEEHDFWLFSDSALHETEAEAIDQNCKLQMAITLANLGVWELDLYTKSLSTSPECRAHLGLSPSASSLSYREMLDLLEDSPRLEGAVALGTNFALDLRLRTGNWVSFQGRFCEERLIGVTSDVTERRTAAERLEKRTARLEQTISELEMLAVNLSHDLRGPLRSLAGSSGLLLQECKDEALREHAEKMAAAAAKMNNIIDDVLDFMGAIPERLSSLVVDDL